MSNVRDSTGSSVADGSVCRSERDIYIYIYIMYLAQYCKLVWLPVIVFSGEHFCRSKYSQRALDGCLTRIVLETKCLVAQSGRRFCWSKLECSFSGPYKCTSQAAWWHWRWFCLPCKIWVYRSPSVGGSSVVGYLVSRFLRFGGWQCLCLQGQDGLTLQIKALPSFETSTYPAKLPISPEDSSLQCCATDSTDFEAE
jgi:hypothetical protein